MLSVCSPRSDCVVAIVSGLNVPYHSCFLPLLASSTLLKTNLNRIQMDYTIMVVLNCRMGVLV